MNDFKIKPQGESNVSVVTPDGFYVFEIHPDGLHRIEFCNSDYVAHDGDGVALIRREYLYTYPQNVLIKWDDLAHPKNVAIGGQVVQFGSAQVYLYRRADEVFLMMNRQPGTLDGITLLSIKSDGIRLAPVVNIGSIAKMTLGFKSLYGENEVIRVWRK